MKQSSDIILQDRRDESTCILRNLQKVQKKHNSVRKHMVRQMKDNTKDVNKDLQIEIQKQTKYLDILNKDITRKKKQQLSTKREQVRIQKHVQTLVDQQEILKASQKEIERNSDDNIMIEEDNLSVQRVADVSMQAVIR